MLDGLEDGFVAAEAREGAAIRGGIGEDGAFCGLSWFGWLFEKFCVFGGLACSDIGFCTCQRCRKSKLGKRFLFLQHQEFLLIPFLLLLYLLHLFLMHILKSCSRASLAILITPCNTIFRLKALAGMTEMIATTG